MRVPTNGGLVRGSVRDAVVLNAAAGLAAHAGFGADLDADLLAGMSRADAALDAGTVSELLARWVALGASLS